ncbi:hypothetical protein Q5P01_012128 [Channa striata]|uniref:Uncharacterized protein n=1 Tax=Channa striata TaxID=64152 RepID=A0AA88SMI8_CHASR|nr:hypothetical protein Q5P01_012128 [Channa striata]
MGWKVRQTCGPSVTQQRRRSVATSGRILRIPVPARQRTRDCLQQRTNAIKTKICCFGDAQCKEDLLLNTVTDELQTPA